MGLKIIGEMPRHRLEIVRNEHPFRNGRQSQHLGVGHALVPQHMPVGDVIEELLLIWGATDAEEWRDRWQALPLPHGGR